MKGLPNKGFLIAVTGWDGQKNYSSDIIDEAGISHEAEVQMAQQSSTVALAGQSYVQELCIYLTTHMRAMRAIPTLNF